MSSVTPALSIIIPSYNEELRLPATLERIAAYVAACRWDAEILVVDDGSRDRTAEVAESFRDKFPSLRVVSNGVNRGKGFSVRHGMQEAHGGFALFTDADLSAPIEDAGKLLRALETQNYDVAIGSRALDRSLILVHESPFREFAGIVFNKIVRASRPFAGNAAVSCSSSRGSSASASIRSCSISPATMVCGPWKFPFAGDTPTRPR